MTNQLDFDLNGVPTSVALDGHESLLRLVRDRCGLTGTKEGCDDSECGACMVLVDGAPVNSCSYLAMQVASREVTTIEGVGHPGGLDPVQEAMLECGGVQCGFCTPGMVISAKALLARNPRPTGDQIRAALAGNLCRCTGYTKIVAAVALAAQRGASEGGDGAPPGDE